MKRNNLYKSIALTLSILSASAIAPIRANAEGQAYWQSLNNSWYYMDSTGKAKTGWVKDGEDWYYLNSNGVMQTGWIQDGGNWYYLWSNGQLATNTNVYGYYVNSSGAWQKSGIDYELTEQLKQSLVYGTNPYTGTKVNDINSIMSQVAEGTLSKEDALSNLMKMKWTEENLSTIDYNYHGTGDVSVYAAKVEKFDVGVGKTAKEIAKEYRSYIRPSTFTNLVAYRNADNSITITSINCSLSVTNIRN